MNPVSLSLIIPTYNRANLIAKVLESIARSRVSELGTIEIIVVDNNSTDNTKAIVETFKGQGFPFNLRYLLEPRQGVSRARNTGIANARGVYIAFMDDDQRIEENYLATVESVFLETQAACVGGPVLCANLNGMPAWMRDFAESRVEFDAGQQTRALSPSEQMLNGGNMAVKRDVLLEAGGFDESMGPLGTSRFAHEDREIQHRLYAAGYTVFYSPKLIQYHDLRGDRFTKRYWRRYQFDWGRTNYRHDWTIPEKPGDKRLFGTPTWLWRSLVTGNIPRYLKSLFNSNRAARFRREIEVFERLGHIYEARLKYRRSAEASPRKMT